MKKNSSLDEKKTESPVPPLIFYNPSSPTAENQKNFSDDESTLWSAAGNGDSFVKAPLKYISDDEINDEDLTIYRKSR